MGEAKPLSIFVYAASCIIITIIGAMLLSLSTIIVAPYETIEHYQYVGLRHWYNDTMTINPNSSRTYDFTPDLYMNSSLLQVTLTVSGRLNVSLYNHLHPDSGLETELLLNEHLGVAFRGEYGKKWVTYFWTPPGPQRYTDTVVVFDTYYGDLSFVFQNPEDFANQISFQIKIFTVNRVGEREVTTYHSVVDTQFAYVGIGLIVFAAIFEAVLLVKKSS